MEPPLRTGCAGACLKGTATTAHPAPANRPHRCGLYCDFDALIERDGAEAIERFIETVSAHLCEVHHEDPLRAAELVRRLLESVQPELSGTCPRSRVDS